MQKGNRSSSRGILNATSAWNERTGHRGNLNDRDNDRRAVLGGALAVAAGAAIGWVAGTPAALAAALPDPPSIWFREALAKLVGDRKVEARLVKIEMPELAENGNMVPFTMSVDSPMTPDNYVRTVTILSPANPQPVIAAFELFPASGVARISGRLRLAKTQDVLVIAELSSGQLVSGTRRVDVTVGGCGVG